MATPHNNLLCKEAARTSEGTLISNNNVHSIHRFHNRCRHLVWQGMQSRAAGTKSRNAVSTNPVQSSTMPQTGAPPTQRHSNGNAASDPEGNGRNRLPECDSTDYVMNCIHENTPLSLNEIARPVFINHYYTGEPLIPVTSKKLIRLDEYDVSTEISARNLQPQGPTCESVEASRDSLRMPIPNKNVGPPPLEKDQERGL